MRTCGECKWLDLSTETESSRDRRAYYAEHPEKLRKPPERPDDTGWVAYDREQSWLIPHYACTAPAPISAAIEWTDDMAIDSPADDCPCFKKRKQTAT